MAGASTITYTSSFGPQNTDFLASLNLPQWDPASFPGEVLTGVALTFGFSDNVNTITLTNSASSSETFMLTVNSDVFTGPQSGLPTTPSSIAGPPDAMSPNMLIVPLFSSGVITLGPGGSGPCPFATPSGACSVVQYDPGVAVGTASVNANPANFGFYTGSGTFLAQTVTQADTHFVGGGNNIQLSVTDSAMVTESVTYTYTDSGAPEPATMAMLGSALFALGVLGRKKLAR